MEFESPPEHWTPQHSVGVVLIGMAMVDGDVDPSELRAFIEVLRGFPGIDEVRAGSLSWEVYRHLAKLHEDNDGHLVLGTLRHHGLALVEHYDKPTLQSIYERLEDMASADGDVHPMERRLLGALHARWGLGD